MWFNQQLLWLSFANTISMGGRMNVPYSLLSVVHWLALHVVIESEHAMSRFIFSLVSTPWPLMYLLSGSQWTGLAAVAASPIAAVSLAWILSTQGKRRRERTPLTLGMTVAGIRVWMTSIVALAAFQFITDV